MDICHTHNLVEGPAASKPYGIRVSLPAGDTFSELIGAQWERFHWFASSQERDRALQEMAGEHLYSRRGDRPRLIFEAVQAPQRSDSD